MAIIAELQIAPSMTSSTLEAIFPDSLAARVCFKSCIPQVDVSSQDLEGEMGITKE